MEKKKNKFDFVKRIFGFKQCDCLDKKVPKIKVEEKKECKNKKSCCLKNKDN